MATIAMRRIEREAVEAQQRRIDDERARLSAEDRRRVAAQRLEELARLWE
jgi:hypothetical protein